MRARRARDSRIPGSSSWRFSAGLDGRSAQDIDYCGRSTSRSMQCSRSCGYSTRLRQHAGATRTCPETACTSAALMSTHSHEVGRTSRTSARTDPITSVRQIRRATALERADYPFCREGKTGKRSALAAGLVSCRTSPMLRRASSLARLWVVALLTDAPQGRRTPCRR